MRASTSPRAPTTSASPSIKSVEAEPRKPRPAFAKAVRWSVVRRTTSRGPRPPIRSAKTRRSSSVMASRTRSAIGPTPIALRWPTSTETDEKAGTGCARAGEARGGKAGEEGAAGFRRMRFAGRRRRQTAHNRCRSGGRSQRRPEPINAGDDAGSDATPLEPARPLEGEGRRCGPAAGRGELRASGAIPCLSAQDALRATHPLRRTAIRTPPRDSGQTLPSRGG